MEAAYSPITTEVSAAMTPGVARALVRLHAASLKVIEVARAAAGATSGERVAEATAMLVIAYSAYRAKVTAGGDRTVTLVLTADQHAALEDVKAFCSQLGVALSSAYSHQALSLAHGELVRAIETWARAARVRPPVFRGATALAFE